MINVHVIFNQRDPRMARSLSWHSWEFSGSSWIGSQIQLMIMFRYFNLSLTNCGIFPMNASHIKSVFWSHGTFKRSFVSELYGNRTSSRNFNVSFLLLQWRSLYENRKLCFFVLAFGGRHHLIFPVYIIWIKHHSNSELLLV